MAIPVFLVGDAEMALDFWWISCLEPVEFEVKHVHGILERIECTTLCQISIIGIGFLG